VSQLINATTKEWDVQILNRYFYKHDIDEILKIKIPRTADSDFMGWHYDKSGCFSVRSAYKLGVDIRDLDLEEGMQSSSSNTDGMRRGSKKLWALPVPQKVKVFAWKLIHNGLANQANKKSRRMEHLSNCLLCGDDQEDCYHVVMQCPHAVNLHAAMRLRWCLPAERELKFTGPEWLLGIVDTQPVEQVACLLLIFWRAWFIRNELTHSNKKLSLEGSVSFLENYWETLCGIR